MRKRAFSATIALVLLIAVLACTLSACGGTSSPKAVTETFFSAVKAGDLEKAIECFTPSAQAQYKAMLAVSDALFGVDTGSILGGIVGYANEQEYKSYSFKVKDVNKTDDSHATVSVDVIVNGQKNRTTSVSCVRIDKKWYIVP